MEKSDFDTEKEFRAEKKKHREVLNKVNTLLVNYERDNLKELNEELMLKKAGVTEKDYYKALGVSLKGIQVVHKREPEDIFVNNYNKVQWC